MANASLGNRYPTTVEGSAQYSRRSVLLPAVTLPLLSLSGAASAQDIVDAVKGADPSIPTAAPPRIGDAIEAGAKIAGSTEESTPPADVGKALKEGIKSVEVPDPLKTVLPDTKAGFNIQDKTVGKGESRDPVRSAIVDKALTEQSPKRNYNN